MVPGWLSAPIDDYLAGVERLRGAPVAPVIAVLLAGVGASWWVYVPVHELLHAYGCLWSGGEVTRLEIDAVYGAAWLQPFFPFVAVGSDYAGQLTGFDTGGSDAVYLVTVLAPFVLTVFPGVPLLRAAARRRTPFAAAATLGAAVPLAFAPAISLPGDFYEAGSILVTRLVALVSPGFDVDRWRSDDVFLLVASLPGGVGGSDWIGIPASFVLGCALALATYAAGRALDRRLFGGAPPGP